ncbi:T9SS type A sorting domain-containing protein [Olleya sp. R77988]|uniref:T9SS type A sorting domain-containing protein n=1 Tax=Olleya sp. R77988 TaxID=3093875 RepID=UPI0037C9B96F
MKKIYFLLFTILIGSSAFGQNLIITGVFDGPLPGGLPKGVELYVIADIADLSTYGIGSANNGGGTDGEELTFPPVAIAAGSYIYVASETVEFTNFFGFAPDYTDSALNINGDDAIELFENGSVIDTFGDINVDGTGQAWEYLDGWAFRKPGTVANPTFNLADWTFSGPNALDGETSNATATTPMPLESYTGNPLSNEDFASSTFSIFPNPTNTGYITIKTTSKEAINVSVFNVLGEQVVSQTLKNNVLNLSDLASGVYILRLSQNETVATKKLVIN